MSSACDDDPLLLALAALPTVRLDETRADQLRGQCRALLEKPPRQMPLPLESVAVGGVCAVYAWQIVKMVIR